MAMGCIRSKRTVKGVVTRELRYYLTTLTDVAAFAHSVRTHWEIENRLHWVLDVVFQKDYARNRKDHSATNMAPLRKITANLIRVEPMEKYRTRKFSL
jgi:predicted transposase YbfD/YdcC